MSIINNGQLRVWWIPQIPGKPFYVGVKNLFEAKMLLQVLADYDQFQFDNNIKGDYSNVGGLQIWEDEIDEDEDGSKWIDWEDLETGLSFDEYAEKILE